MYIIEIGDDQEDLKTCGPFFDEETTTREFWYLVRKHPDQVISVNNEETHVRSLYYDPDLER